MKVFVVICFNIVDGEITFADAGVFNLASDAVAFGKRYRDSIVVDRIVS